MTFKGFIGELPLSNMCDSVYFNRQGVSLHNFLRDKLKTSFFHLCYLKVEKKDIHQKYLHNLCFSMHTQNNFERDKLKRNNEVMIMIMTILY